MELPQTANLVTRVVPIGMAYPAASTYPAALAITRCSATSAILGGSGCPGSSALVVSNGLFITPAITSPAAPVGLLVTPVGQRFPDGASSGSPGNGTRCRNSGAPVIPNGMLVTPVGASIAAPTSLPIVLVRHKLPIATDSRSSGNSSNLVDSGV